jgi:hypothetical protein
MSSYTPPVPPVEFAELHGSPREALDMSTGAGFNATRELRCKWEDRLTLMDQLMGKPYVHNAQAIAVRASCRPLTGEAIDIAATTDAEYTEAIVTVEYQYFWELVEDEDDVAVISESYEPSVEFQTIDYTRLKWSDGTDLRPDDAPGKLMPTGQYTFTYLNMPPAAIPVDLPSMVGSVNSLTIIPRTAGLNNWTFPAGTLLMLPPTFERTIFALSGTGTWRATFRFAYRPNKDGETERGWNWFYDLGTQSWKQFKFRGTDTVYNPYPSANFRGLMPWSMA